MKNYQTCCAAFVLLLGAWTVTASTNLVGLTAPAHVFRTLSDNPSKMYQSLERFCYQGPLLPQTPRTAVVLNFMSLKCPPCHKELPLFLEVVRSVTAEAEKNKTPFRFFLVSLDPLSAQEDVRKYMQEMDLSVDRQVLLDPYKKAADKFGVVTLPRTFVISAYGRITADISGALDTYSDRLKAGINEALKAEGPK